MDATPTSPGNESAGSGGLPTWQQPGFGRNPAGALAAKWSALHDAAAVVGAVAGLAAEAMRPELGSFPAVMQAARGWRRELAEQGIEDLTAIMEPGLSALLAVHARGASAAAPAHALWREFVSARDALLTLVPPPAE